MQNCTPCLSFRDAVLWCATFLSQSYTRVISFLALYLFLFYRFCSFRKPYMEGALIEFDKNNDLQSANVAYFWTSERDLWFPVFRQLNLNIMYIYICVCVNLCSKEKHLFSNKAGGPWTLGWHGPTTTHPSRRENVPAQSKSVSFLFCSTNAWGCFKWKGILLQTILLPTSRHTVLMPSLTTALCRLYRCLHLSNKCVFAGRWQLRISWPLCALPFLLLCCPSYRCGHVLILF